MYDFFKDMDNFNTNEIQITPFNSKKLIVESSFIAPLCCTTPTGLQASFMLFIK